MAEWNECFYCGEHLSRKKGTFDHIVPKSYGGTKLVNACQPCNNEKADLSLEQFRTLKGVDQFHGERLGYQPW